MHNPYMGIGIISMCVGAGCLHSAYRSYKSGTIVDPNEGAPRTFFQTRTPGAFCIAVTFMGGFGIFATWLGWEAHSMGHDKGIIYAFAGPMLIPLGIYFLIF